MIFVEHKRKAEKNIFKKYGECVIADVTSNAKNDLVKLSPFYPHGKIPIPFSNGFFSESVEGVWQGLKVFQSHGIEHRSFKNATGKNIKRTVRKFGLPLGHQKGINSDELLDYISARKLIYLPTYKFVLENYCYKIVNRLKVASKNHTIVLLDYSTNGDVFNTKTPLSHAYLIKLFCENKYFSADQTELYKSDKATIVMEEIYKFIGNNAYTSKEIISKLSLNISANKLTAILKKESEIMIVGTRPLKFQKSNIQLLF